MDEITRRDYFAAHALFVGGCPEWYRKQVEARLPPRPEWDYKNPEATGVWEELYQKELESTWPWVYADMVLARRT